MITIAVILFVYWFSWLRSCYFVTMCAIAERFSIVPPRSRRTASHTISYM